MNMPIGEVLSKSFKYTKDNKALWFYGVLLAIFSGGGGNFSNYQVDEKDANFFSNFGTITWVIFGVVILVFLILFIILGTIIANWSEGAIINGTEMLESGKPITRKEIGKIGKRTVWNLIILNAIIPMLIIIVLVILIVLGVFLFSAIPQPTGLVAGVVTLVLFIIAIIPLVIYWGLIWGLASRFVVIEKKKAIESLKAARALIKGKFWWSFLYSLVLGMISGFIGFAAALPLLLAGFGFGFSLAYKSTVLAIILGILTLFTLVVMIFATGILQAFSQTGWTLWWMELKKLKTSA